MKMKNTSACTSNRKQPGVIPSQNILSARGKISANAFTLCFTSQAFLLCCQDVSGDCDTTTGALTTPLTQRCVTKCN